MNKLLTYISFIFLLACSGRNVKDTIENHSKYTLIRDNLYSDKEGNLYLKSVNNEDVKNKYDVWLNTVFCDTCQIATEEGIEDITELKDVVDVQSFQLKSRDDEKGGILYEDKNYLYFHKLMADGGTITLMGKQYNILIKFFHMKTFLINSLIILSGIYVLLCMLLYFFQEKMIFHPQKMDANYQFQFDAPFEETNIKMADGTTLNGLLFKANESKGLIFYLHGNGGSLSSWGDVAKTYTDLNYDVFILDYRGYGKSEGSINGQQLFFEDVQTVYNELKKTYPENKIIVLGYSIGSGTASKIASTNNPKLLILQAPYYSLTDIVQKHFPIIPSFILKYPFETNRYLKDCKMPVVLFHGDQDEVIYYGSSLKLQKEFKHTDTLITLKGQYHNGITYNKDYKTEIKKILAKE